MSLLDLFVPPVVRPRANGRVHRTADDASRIERRKARYARWHAENRERHLAAMRARYAAKRQEYIDKARRWDAANPERKRAIKLAANRRYRARRREVYAQRKGQT